MILARSCSGAALVLLVLNVSPAQAQDVASFDTAWAAIQRTHFDTTFNGVDWAAVRDELRPRALAAANPAELRAVIGLMLARLHQSHFYLIPAAPQEASEADAGGDGEPGIEVRLIGGSVLVTEVSPEGSAAAAGIRRGWELEAIDGRAVGSMVLRFDSVGDERMRQLRAWSAVRAALSGEPGTTRVVTLRDGRGRRVGHRLALREPGGQVTRFGGLPPLRVRLDTSTVHAGGRRIGVIRFNLWLPALSPALDRAVDQMRADEGIIIDLRGNVGGAGGMAMGIAGHFIDRPDTLGAMRLRSTTLQFVVNPRRVDTSARRVQPFAGPVAILIDATTASTSEVFAGGMQRLGRARVFGSTSAGQALPAFMTRLPGGDLLVHAMADFTSADGHRLEGAGVTPDVGAPYTRAGLLQGRDETMKAALAWITGQGSH
jgi:carboxyl-terminal processing protease